MRVGGIRPLILASAALLLAAVHGAGTAAAARGRVGERSPAFSAKDLKGQPHSLDAYKGKTLVLHFWASWCPYCRSEIDELVALHGNDWASRGVRVVTVSVDENLAQLEQFVFKAKLPYPVIPDVAVNSSIADHYGISGIPVTLIVGPDGRIASRLNGASKITEAVERALRR